MTELEMAQAVNRCLERTIESMKKQADAVLEGVPKHVRLRLDQQEQTLHRYERVMCNLKTEIRELEDVILQQETELETKNDQNT